MIVSLRVAAILFLSVFNCAIGCDVGDVAVYNVKLRMLWSEETFPKDYPNNRPKAQWSPVFGQSHNSSYKLYHIGEVARDSVRDFAQFGGLDGLVREGEEEVKVYDQFSAPAVGRGVGETKNLVLVDGHHSLVSLISRIIPSPDWFIGVDSLDLCVDSAWIDQITLDLKPLDAGAASGLTFTAPRWKTVPSEPVTKHGPKRPKHPAAGFYYPNLKELPTIATVEFVKMEEYSTKDLNLLAKQKLITLLKLKDKQKGYPKKVVTEEPLPVEEMQEVTTRSHLDTLKDLEEDPVGTPSPNLPDNNVYVFTKPTTTTTTESEFDSDLRNMDDVVLAVAHGRRLGLRKHLPRHFRSRLHHAVNRIQHSNPTSPTRGASSQLAKKALAKEMHIEPDWEHALHNLIAKYILRVATATNDCLTSEWSEWTPCSVTCGFGDKFRTRTILREKKEGGRDCPTLTDRKHCGNVNSCSHIDYFEW